MRNYEKLSYCILCYLPFTKEDPYYELNFNRKCYARHRYATSADYRRLHYLATRKWMDKNPEKVALIQKRAGKKYRNSHKKEISLRNKTRYAAIKLVHQAVGSV